MHNSNDAKEALLYLPLSTGGDAEYLHEPAPRTQSRKLLIASLACNAVFLACIVVLAVHSTSLVVWRGVRPGYSPVQDHITHKHVLFPKLAARTKYHGPPTDEVDAAWLELYDLGISSIPKSQAALLPNRTEPFPGDEGNYIVSLDVFHQLHCLDRLRKAIWPDRYPQSERFQNLTHLPNTPLFDHTDHCINSLRESIMCNADTTPFVWRWSKRHQASIPRVDVAHTCRDFGEIHKWAEKTTSKMHFDVKTHVMDDLVFPDDEDDN